MEPANLGVVLDSSAVIEAERQRLDVARFLKHISTRIGERKAALCPISVAEIAHGVHRAGTPERRQTRRAFLDDRKATIPFSMTCSSVLARLNVATLSPRETLVTSG